MQKISLFGMQFTIWRIVLICVVTLLVPTLAASDSEIMKRSLAVRHGGIQPASLVNHDRISANCLQESLSHQNNNSIRRSAGYCRSKYFTPRKQERSWRQSMNHDERPVRKGSLQYAVRVGLAGGLAGAAGTAVLFPMDTAKTLRQANPSTYKSVMSALLGLCHSNGRWHINRVYRGIIPSALGAIPSSALYFGAYESMKAVMRQATCADSSTTRGRVLVHSLSAASGNVLSSCIFVPKEAIKQQMQYLGNANILQASVELCKSKGIRGLYSGYRATLLRNIPTAALRFTLYEELKHLWLSKASADETCSSLFNWELFGAGALAGVAASAFSKT